MKAAINRLESDIDALEAQIAVINSGVRLAPWMQERLRAARVLLDRMRADVAQMRIRAGLNGGREVGYEAVDS
jgi:hypothetical protein